jgi:hypothetical protein
MKKYYCIIIFSFFVNIQLGFSQKQDLNKDYSPLVSAGEIPDDFLIMTYEKFQKDKDDLGKGDSRKDRIAKTEFLLSSNYGIDNLLQSGRVIFGDPVSEYVNKVADKLLEKEPELRKKLRFYTLKSTEVNAFATNQGIVFVSVGLVAQVMNEAQLAFVLAHEIGHYVEEHVINSYVDAKKILRSGSRSYDDLENTLSDYSKEKEFEADEFALKLMAKTDYDLDEAAGVFEVLQYSYLPFDEVPLDTLYFNDKYYKIPNNYFLGEVMQIKGEDDYDDSKSSHPNIRKRKEQYDKFRKKENKGNGTKHYLTSKEEFEYAQWLCRFEMSRLFQIRRSYGMAFYNSYLLALKFPENAFAHAYMAKSIYFLSKYKTPETPFKLYEEKMKIISNTQNKKRTEEFVVKYNNIEGEVQQVFHLFHKLSAMEMNILATRLIWTNYLKHGDKHGMKYFARETLYDLVHLFEIDKEKLIFDPNNIVLETTTQQEEEKEEKKELSKYEKIKKKKKEVEEENNYWIYAFTDTLFRNPEFIKQFEDDLAEREKISVEVENLRSLKSKEKAKFRKEYFDNQKEKQNRGLGIDRIVVFDPFYYNILLTFDGNTKLNLIESEKKRIEYNNRILTTSASVGLDVEMLTYNTLTKNDVENFNDLALLNEWYYERGSHKSTILQVSELHRLKGLNEKYNTPYFSSSGVILAQNTYLASEYTLGIFFIASVYLAPWGVHTIMKGKKETLVFNSIYNIENGAPVLNKKTTYKLNDSKDYINSTLYIFYSQVKKNEKK